MTKRQRQTQVSVTITTNTLSGVQCKENVVDRIGTYDTNLFTVEITTHRKKTSAHLYIELLVHFYMWF